MVLVEELSNEKKELIKDFSRLYDEVFDTDGNIKACGRAKCIELINAAEKIKSIWMMHEAMGNETTGYINVNQIRTIRKFIEHGLTENFMVQD